MNVSNLKTSDTFASTLIGVCTGTNIFLKLSKGYFYRSLRHFLIVSVLASMAYVILKGPYLFKYSYAYCDMLHKYFSGLKISSEGVFPLKDAGTRRSVRIINTRIDYIPSKQDISILSEPVENNGVLWFPDSIYYWIKTSYGYNYIPLSIFLGIPSNMDKKVKNAPTMTELLAVVRVDSFDFSMLSGRGDIDFSQIGFMVFSTLLIFYFISILANILFSVPLYALVILSVFSFFGSKLLRKLKAVDLFSVILYASFPGIIIGVLYSGLSLPYLDFKTVCFVVFSIYTFVVIGNLQRKLFPSKDDEEDYDEDIF